MFTLETSVGFPPNIPQGALKEQTELDKQGAKTVWFYNTGV